MTPTIIQLISSALFAIAILHTFSTNFFERLAHTQPAHAGLWHFLGLEGHSHHLPLRLC
ncbi:putative Na+/H+ antiporter [Nitrosospira multiformis]|uniref:putative Na+/H+ antiporter n=1 Tax=Nitrosospira multiformis TaxID=1231 RepID=UPI003F6E2E32